MHVVKKRVTKKLKDYYVPTTNEILRELKYNFPHVLEQLPKNPKKSLIVGVCLENRLLHAIEERVALKRALTRHKIDFKHDTHVGELVSLAMSNKLNFDKIG
tara:strand:- start:254 stop:559 length:306 start_codon:yes stop_codon:yes gene_type:complete